MFEPSSVPLRRLVWIALALSLGAAVSLGITRFAYGLLLPVMRADLGWSYTLAGAMNALAGGGSFVTLPALILAGVPSTVANATSTVALFPGALASAWRCNGHAGTT